MDHRTTNLLALWNSLCGGLVGAAWSFGLIGPIFTEDASHVTALIAVLLVLTILYCVIQTIRIERMVSGNLPHHELIHRIEDALALPAFMKSRVFLYLGLAGTLIGLSRLASHLVVGSGEVNADAIAAVMASMKANMEIAFNCTLVGIVAKLWVEVITFIQSWPVRRLHTDSLLSRGD